MPDLHTDINIHETINSGQIFLWENYGNEWFVIDGHDVIMAKQKPFEIITFSKKPKNFFREDDNYRKILKNITKDKIVKKASKYYPGLRVTRQDPFQCCISFIISANSNIPNIRMRLQKLCIKFGTKVRFQKREFFLFAPDVTYSFPRRPTVLKDPTLDNLLNFPHRMWCGIL